MEFSNINIQIKNEFNKRWLKVFYHNCAGGVWFNTEEEIKYIDEPQRYSILGLVNNKLNFGGYYEFLLQYPEFEGYNNWKQKLFPFTYEFMSQNSGYTCSPQEGLHCSWNGFDWRGLYYSTSSSTFIDGSNNTYNYWFAIGSKKGYSNAVRFPGPVGGTASNNGSSVTEVYLWIRIPNSFFIHQSALPCYFIYNSKFLFFIISISSN